MPLEIAVRQTTVVTLKGRLDTDTAPAAEQAMGPVLATAPPHVVFDLGGLQFISSAGLRVLLLARKKLTEIGSECLLLNVQPQIARVLEVVKVLPDLRLFSTPGELDEYLVSIQRKVLDGD
jgi:anti-anti-sigma factor